MENVKNRVKCFLQKSLNKCLEVHEHISIVAPWFDAITFIREFLWALSVYTIIKSGPLVCVCFVVYQTLTTNVNNVSSVSEQDKNEHILATLLNLIVSFVIRLFLMFYISSLSFPSLLLHSYLRAQFDPNCNILKHLDKGFFPDIRQNVAVATNRPNQRATQGRVALPDRLANVSGIIHRIPSRVDTDDSLLPDFPMETDGSTSDNKQVAWMNKVIAKLWPHIGTFIEDLVMYRVLEDLSIEIKDKSLTSGEIPPRLSSVRVREESTKIFIDIDMRYDGDFSAYVKWRQVELEIDHLTVDAQLQIELRNFACINPFIGEVVIHMDQPPTIDVTLKKVASIIEAIKPVKNLFLQYIQDNIKKHFPHRITLLPDDV